MASHYVCFCPLADIQPFSQTWSLITLRKKLLKTGAKVAHYDCHVPNGGIRQYHIDIGNKAVINIKTRIDGHAPPDRMLTVTCSRASLRQWLIDPKADEAKPPTRYPNDVIELAVPFTLKRRGVEAKLIIDNGDHALLSNLDPALIKAVARARIWNQRLISGKMTSLRAIAKSESVTHPYVKRLIKLAFLAPDIVETILAGRQPVDLTAERLTRLVDLPDRWDQQRRLLGLSN
jgi:hypothetical protein